MTTATHRRILAATLAAAAIALAGCDNRHLIGTFDGGAGPADDGALPPDFDALSPDSSTSPPPDGRPNLPDAGDLGPLQSWTGYIENYQFKSGSDTVRIAFASDSAGNVVGKVILGNATPPPPPTDPNVGYPADLVGAGPPQIGGAAGYVAEGYAYTMRDATLSGRRLQFGVGLWELWQGWCALETPVDGSSLCVHNWGSMLSGDGMHCALLNPTTNQYEPIDCGKLQLCLYSMVCRCDATSCSVQDTGSVIEFDVTITNDLADGSTTVGGNRNVHFTKGP